MNSGALHVSPDRQLIAPLPYSPPKMNAPFFRLGITATQCARSQYSCGTSVRISLMTVAASVRRLISSAAASPAKVHASATPPATERAMRYILNPSKRSLCNSVTAAGVADATRETGISSAFDAPTKKAGSPQEGRACLDRAVERRDPDRERSRVGRA